MLPISNAFGEDSYPTWGSMFSFRIRFTSRRRNAFSVVSSSNFVPDTRLQVCNKACYIVMERYSLCSVRLGRRKSNKESWREEFKWMATRSHICASVATPRDLMSRIHGTAFFIPGAITRMVWSLRWRRTEVVRGGWNFSSGTERHSQLTTRFSVSLYFLV